MFFHFTKLRHSMRKFSTAIVVPSLINLTPDSSSSSTFFAALSLVLVSMACSCWKCVLQLLVFVMFFAETMGGVGFGTLSFGLILGTITAFIYLRKTGRLLVQASTDHWLPMTSAEVTCWRHYVPGTYPGQDILTERWINENWADCLLWSHSRTVWWQ